MRFDSRRFGHARVLALVVGLPCLGAPPCLAATSRVTAVTEPTARSYKELMHEAEAKQGVGAYAESAALFAQAYRSRPPEKRADDVGEITVESALADYRLASEQAPANIELLDARARLLDEFLTAREQAKPKAVPQAMRDELTQVRTQIAELREAERSAREEPVEPEPAVETPIEVEPPPGKSTNPKVNATLLTLGLASVVGGTVVLAVGARNSSQIDARGEEWLAALDAVPEYTEQQRQEFRDAVAAWEQDNRATARGLIIGGTVLAAAGIGLSAWGLVRMVKRRKQPTPRSARATPLVSREHFGLQLTLDF